jgi:mRNA interferase MazF
MSPVIHRGDVWWADVPGDKLRPVVVLTRERFTSRLNTLLVAPVTTTVRNIPTEVGLDVGDGLPRDGAANFDNVFTLRRSRFKSRITRLGNDRLAEVCRAYRFAAGC